MKYLVLTAMMGLTGCGVVRGVGETMSNVLSNEDNTTSSTPVPVNYPTQGSVCGDPMLRGSAIAPVTGPGACGIPDAVRIDEVAGLKLSTPARIDCVTAQSLSAWVQNSALPAIGNMGGGAKEIYIMASYSCRTRNSRPGAKLSEHALGHALDVGGFVLRDGSRISVLNDWGSGAKGAALRRMRAGACGPFGTVLGPGSDRHHSNHFHFDTARYRGGPYCK